MVFTDERQRDRQFLAMQMDMMSSEESEVEGDEEAIVVKPLPWRSDSVNQMIKRLDDTIRDERSSQARCQAKARDYSRQPSSCAKPISGDLAKCTWLFKE